MTDSWESFAQALHEESRSLELLNAGALNLTQALIEGDVEIIAARDRELNAYRQKHSEATTKRRGMQARGFGALTLQHVCRYAPPHLNGRFNQHLSELTCGAISLGLTVANNKALILSGLERVMHVTAKLQESVSERPGIYKRRGHVPPPTGSVLVSSKC